MKFALLLFGTALAAQTVEGNLYDSLTGAPVTGAYVSLTGDSTPENKTLTRSDAAGHFSLTPAAPVVDPRKPYISVARAGYLSGGTRIDPQRPSELRIPLTPEGFLSGKLVDQEGFPVQGARVVAVYYMVTAVGERLPQPAGDRVVSDDLGNFRIGNLRAGHYFIQVQPQNLTQWDGRYTGQYLPGGFRPDEAHAIDVAAGQEHSLGELTVRQLPAVNVTGRVVLPGGSQASDQNWRVELNPGDRRYPLPSPPQPTNQNRADGRFSFAHVLPGRYNLVASTGRGGTPEAGDFEVTSPVEVGSSDVNAGALTLLQVNAVDLTGTVAMKDGSIPAPVTITLRTERRTNGVPEVSTKSNPDGTFVFKGMLPGHYIFSQLAARQTSKPEASVRSAKLGDQEVLQTGIDLDGNPKQPLRITMSSQPIPVRGRLLDGDGKPLANSLIRLATDGPYSEALVHTDLDGWFSAPLATPGAYHILAIADGRQENLLNDQDYLAAHFQDFPVTQIVDGQNQPILLTMPAAK